MCTLAPPCVANHKCGTANNPQHVTKQHVELTPSAGMSVPTRTNTTSDRRAFLNVCHPLPYPHHPHHCDCPLWQTYSSSQRWWPKPPKKTRRKVSRPAASVCKCRPLPSASHCDVSAAHCLSKWTKRCLCVCVLDEPNRDLDFGGHAASDLVHGQLVARAHRVHLD